jgi:hypothetical protein
MNATQTEYLVAGCLPLDTGEELRVVHGKDMLVHLWQGSVWLTQEGDARDVVLTAGQWFRLDRNGVALARAWEPTVLALTSPHETSYARGVEVVTAPPARQPCAAPPAWVPAAA